LEFAEAVMLRLLMGAVPTLARLMTAPCGTARGESYHAVGIEFADPVTPTHLECRCNKHGQLERCTTGSA
jgi:hypothetical protein